MIYANDLVAERFAFTRWARPLGAVAGVGSALAIVAASYGAWKLFKWLKKDGRWKKIHKGVRWRRQ